MNQPQQIARTRAEALATGAPMYYGKTCVNGHTGAPRWTKSYACLECTREGNAEAAARGYAPATAQKRSTEDQLSAADLSFLHHLIILGSRTAAAKIAYYPHVTDFASKAAAELGRKAMQEELAKLRDEVRKATARTVQDIDAQIEAAIEHSISVGNSTSHIRCLEVRAKLFGLITERAQISVQHEHIDLTAARERAMSVRPMRDVIDVTPIEAPMAQLPAKAGGVPVPAEMMRVAESEPIEAEIDPFQ
jgi:hypothetical protein